MPFWYFSLGVDIKACQASLFRVDMAGKEIPQERKIIAICVVLMIIYYITSQGRSRWSGHGRTGFGNGVKLTSSIKSIKFRIYSFCLLFIEINTNLFLLFIRRLRD